MFREAFARYNQPIPAPNQWHVQTFRSISTESAKFLNEERKPLLQVGQVYGRGLQVKAVTSALEVIDRFQFGGWDSMLINQLHFGSASGSSMDRFQSTGLNGVTALDVVY